MKTGHITTIEVFEGDVIIVGLGKALECFCMTLSTFTTQLDVVCPLHGATCQIQIHDRILRMKTSASPIMEDLAEELYYSRKCHPHPPPSRVPRLPLP